MPRVALTVTLVLCLFAGLIGLRAGWVYATLTETDAIEAAVAAYLEDQGADGAAETDCSATPGEGKVWIVVLCLPLNNPGTQRVEYRISRFGQMEVWHGE